MIIQKKEVKLLAYRLGDHGPMEEKLTAEGLIRFTDDGEYRLFSRETRDQGQKAKIGDYFKVDSSGAPYPNDREYFEANHIHLEGDWYLQKSKPLGAWTTKEPMGSVMRFLLDTRALTIDETSADAYFSAFLWGAQLYAARDAIVVFDRVERDDSGKVIDADFHFVARDEFLMSYDILEE